MAKDADRRNWTIGFGSKIEPPVLGLCDSQGRIRAIYLTKAQMRKIQSIDCGEFGVMRKENENRILINPS